MDGFWGGAAAAGVFRGTKKFVASSEEDSSDEDTLLDSLLSLLALLGAS